MLSVFKLTQAINESAAGGFSANSIDAYDFIGDNICENVSEMNVVMLSEATAISSYFVGANEIMSEAAISNPDSLTALSENVFETIGKKVKAFFDKLIAMIKGLIEKLKAFFLRLSGKTDKWLKIMEPRIKTGMGHSGYDDITVNMHKWDVEYVTNGMVNGVDTVMNDGVGSAKNRAKRLLETKNSIKGFKQSVTGSGIKDKDASDPRVANISKSLDDAIDDFDKEAENTDKDISDMAAKALGVSGNTIEDVYSAVAKKATGGEKLDLKISEAGGASSMLTNLRKVVDTIDGLKKRYDKHLANITSLRSDVDKVFAETSIKDSDKYPAEVTAKYDSLISKMSANMTKGLSSCESIVNTLRGSNVKYVQDMASEYMAALSKVASYKGKKD